MTIPGWRPQRVGEKIRTEMSSLLVSGLRDPRIGFTTVTEVSVSPDLRQARIFLSVLGTEEEQKEALAGFDSARNFIRRELAHRLSLRRVPELHFVLDRSSAYADHIEKLLRNNPPGSEPDSSPAGEESRPDNED